MQERGEAQVERGAAPKAEGKPTHPEAHRLLAQCDGNPKKLANLLAHVSTGVRDEVLAEAHQRFGNAFVQEVLATVEQEREHAETPAPANDSSTASAPASESQGGAASGKNFAANAADHLAGGVKSFVTGGNGQIANPAAGGAKAGWQAAETVGHSAAERVIGKVDAFTGGTATAATEHAKPAVDLAQQGPAAVWGAVKGGLTNAVVNGEHAASRAPQAAFDAFQNLRDEVDRLDQVRRGTDAASAIAQHLRRFHDVNLPALDAAASSASWQALHDIAGILTNVAGIASSVVAMMIGKVGPQLAPVTAALGTCADAIDPAMDRAAAITAQAAARTAATAATALSAGGNAVDAAGDAAGNVVDAASQAGHDVVNAVSNGFRHLPH